MSRRFKGLVVAVACLACCIPLVFGILGATTGIAGAVGLWFQQYDLAILAGIGLVTVVWLIVHDHRPTSESAADGDQR